MTGSIFAAYCSLVVFSETVLRTRLTAERAGEVRRAIGIAVGILMATTSSTSPPPSNACTAPGGGCTGPCMKSRDTS